MPKRDDRPIEVLLWGATGFTGRLAAEWLAAHYAGDRIALGGRSQEKLERLREELVAIDTRCAAWPIRIADAFDVPALDRIVPEARVVAAMAGPFSRVGHEVAAACARHGTDYCDITGEVPFARELIDRNHARAKTSGARLVPFCGFDSIPSDLGVYLLQSRVKCAQATFILVRSRGGMSGGTAASMIAIMEQAGSDPRVRAMLANPYALVDDSDHPKARDTSGARKIDDFWTAPFFMGPINSRVVLRSNALLGWSYGHDFRYEERMSLGPGARGFLRAQAFSAGIAASWRTLTLGPVRSVAKRFMPNAGEGPSQELRQKGSYEIRVDGNDSAGNRLGSCRIYGKGDPGYTGAAKMIIESAMCLSRDVEGEGGVLTPASCMGDALAKRLRAADISFDVT